MYLWHWPILSFLQIIDGELPRGDVRILAVLISIVLAWLTFRLLEVPIRRVGNWHMKTTSLFVSMIVVGLVAFAIYKTKGRLLPQTPKQMVSNTAQASPMRKACHFPLKKDFLERNVCEYFETKNLVAVLGNSHGVE